MRIWSVMMNFFAAVFLLFMLLMVYRDVTENEKQLAELRLKYAIDYATEAAFIASLEGGKLGISYEDLENVNIRLDRTLDIFKTSMLLSYGMALSNENYESIENYIAAAALAVSDGYYVAKPREKSYSDLVWGLKKPYIIEYSPTLSVTYTLNTEQWISTQQAGNTVEIARGMLWEDLPGYVETPTRGLVLQEVNNRIMKDLNLIKKQKNTQYITTNGKEEAVFGNPLLDDFIYLPTRQTQTGVNAIMRPSLLVTMAGVDFGGTRVIEAQGVGGYTVAKKRRIVVFIENGTRYYCYEGQIDDTGKIFNFYETPEAAAKAGYTPHLVYLSRPMK